MRFQEATDLFQLLPELIVHPVSCQGLCRDSLSRQLKKEWPEYFKEYTRGCLRGKFKPSEPVLFDLGTMLGTRYVVTLPVRNHWKENLSPDVVKPGVLETLKICVSLNVLSVAIPHLAGTPPGWLRKQFESFFDSHSVLPSTLQEVYFIAQEQ